MSKKQRFIIGVVVVLIGMYIGFKVYASNEAEKSIDKAIADASTYASIDYKNVSVDLLGFNVHISDVLVSSADSKRKVKIDEIAVNDFDQTSDMPKFMNVSFKGIELNLNELGDDATKIKELGYKDKLSLDFSIDYDYNHDDKKLDFRKLKLGADGMGEIEIGFHLGNIALSQDNLLAVLFTYPQIMIQEATIRYKDDSLFDRIMDKTAKEKSKSLHAFKKEKIQEIEQEIQNATDDFTKNALKEIQNFIENPKKLSLTISPSKPLPISSIVSVKDPKDAIKLLNMKIDS